MFFFILGCMILYSSLLVHGCVAREQGCPPTHEYKVYMKKWRRNWVGSTASGAKSTTSDVRITWWSLDFQHERDGFTYIITTTTCALCWGYHQLLAVDTKVISSKPDGGAPFCMLANLRDAAYVPPLLSWRWSPPHGARAVAERPGQFTNVISLAIDGLSLGVIAEV
jgi:hypothetical protein